jgi:hypothetical protein
LFLIVWFDVDIFTQTTLYFKTGQYHCYPWYFLESRAVVLLDALDRDDIIDAKLLQGTLFGLVCEPCHNADNLVIPGANVYLTQILVVFPVHDRATPPVTRISGSAKAQQDHKCDNELFHVSLRQCLFLFL